MRNTHQDIIGGIVVEFDQLTVVNSATPLYVEYHDLLFETVGANLFVEPAA